MWVETTLPPGQAPFVTVFKLSARPWAREADTARARLSQQVDGLSHPPAPFRKQMVETRGSDILLAIECVHLSKAEAEENSFAWARQIARQAQLADQEYEISVVQSAQLAPFRQ